MPQVDYEFNTSTNTMDFLQWQTKEKYMHNLSILLEWSPYSTEIELLKQVSHHSKMSKIIYVCVCVCFIIIAYLLRVYLLRGEEILGYFGF